MKLFKNIICFISVLSLSIFLYSCKNDEHVHNFEKKITPATCTESGTVREVCSCGEMYISTTIPAKGHDYKYTYLYDGTHEQVCRNDSDHRDVVRCSFSSWVTTVEPGTYTEGKEERKCVCGNTQERAIPALHQHQYSSDFVIDVYATCTEDGLKSRHCILGDCNSKIDETVIPKLDHSYGTPEYYWSSDFATVTAKAHCNNDYNHEISETVETTYNLIYNPTCTSEGLANYVSNEFNNKLFSVQSYSVSINPTDHSYEYLITWVDYNPIFVGVCKNDSSHTISKSDVVKSSYLYKESTCTQQGVIIHSAVYTYNGVEYNSTKEEILDSKGHSYICTFTWNEDKASVSIVCENDSSHSTSGDAVVTSEIVTQPTCTQPGKIIYTATFDYNNYSYTDTKEEELPVVDHAYDTYEILKNPNLQENGLIKVVCSYDETHVSEIELPKLNNTDYEAIENQEKTEINYTYKYQDLSINFVVKKFNLTLDANNDLYGSVSDNQAIYETDITTIIATPNDDYKFFGWFDGDIMVSDNTEYTLVMPSKDHNLEARFTKGDYEIIAPETTNVWDGTIASGFAKGSGTPEDPFIITTGAELAYLAYAINNVLNNGQIYYAQGYYKLGNDIDLNNIEWTPIGIAFYDNGGAGNQDYSRVFMGTFDGDSHVINNLKISYLHKPFYRFNGLFGFNMGTIKNIGLENVNISVYAPSYYHYVGALAGYNQGTVTNVYSTGKVEGSAGDSQMYVGGLFGYATGTITNCYSTANISGTSQKYYAYAGGLVGECFAKVSNSFATGNITGGSGTRGFSGYTGGLAGKYSNENNFTNCYVYEGQVLTSSGYINKNSLGISFSETDLNDSSFYFDTLKFDRESWSFENGKLILISNNANSKTFYQLFIEENAGGSVNLKEAILKYGASVKLIVTENEGYEFAGWYSNGVLLSTEKEFTYCPEKSCTILTQFSLQEYNLVIESNVDQTIEGSYEYKYKEEIILDAPKVKGYSFLGWYSGGVLISSTYNLNYVMPSHDCVLTIMYEVLVPDVWDGTITDKLSNGSGTEEDPYLISTAKELAYMAYQINKYNTNVYFDKYYELINDIDLNGISWDPIGALKYFTVSFTDRHYFSGCFEGNGYRIFNFNIETITDYENDFYGLFAINQGTIRNLKVETSDMEFSVVGSYFGVICGSNSGKIENCCTTGNIIFKNLSNNTLYGGGISGSSSKNSVILNCYSECNLNVQGDNVGAFAAGIVSNNRGNILNCYSSGEIRATSRGVGCGSAGIATYQFGNVENCFATGNIYMYQYGGYSSLKFAGGLIANGTETINSYRYVNQIVQCDYEINLDGIVLTDEQLIDDMFYIDVMKFDESIWNIENGKLTLKI